MARALHAVRKHRARRRRCVRNRKLRNRPASVLEGKPGQSVVIGLLLAGVAGLLISESRVLMIGEGVTPETALAIRHIALRNPRVRAADKSNATSG